MLPSQNGTSTTSHLLPVTFSPWKPTASVHLNTYLEYLPTQLTYLPTYLPCIPWPWENEQRELHFYALYSSGPGQWEQSLPPISTWQSNRLRWKVEILRTSIGSMAWRALGRTPLFFTSQARVRPHLNTPWHVHSCHYLKTHVSKWHVKSNVKWRHQSSGTGISELPRAALALACKPWTKASTISPSPNRAFSSASTIEFSISIS